MNWPVFGLVTAIGLFFLANITVLLFGNDIIGLVTIVADVLLVALFMGWMAEA